MNQGFGVTILSKLGIGFFLSVIAVAAVSRVSSASAPPSVCARYIHSDLHREVSRDPDSRFDFKNSGGLMNAGTCWWHSRFQRSVWALAEFRANEPKPTRDEAVRLINGLAHFRGVQIIPGYRDFDSFSADFKPEIQSELNAWQLRDGILNQSWLRGLAGRADLGRQPGRMRKIMDDLYKYTLRGAAENFFPWVMLQLKGIDAHAALVIGMSRLPGGYTMDIVDSNYPALTYTWSYRYGDGQVRDSKYETVPYRGLQRDVTRIRKILKQYCSPSSEKSSRWPSFSVSNQGAEEPFTAEELVDGIEPYLGNDASFRED